MVPCARATTHHPRGVIAAHPEGPETGRVPARRIGVTVLLVVGTLLWTAFGLGLWAKRQALETDNWVETSGDLLQDEQIRSSLAVFLVARLPDGDAVQARLGQVLPPRLARLAAPAAAA